MKLYYSPLACSLAAHIACKEAALHVELVPVELWSEDGEVSRDLRAENPMGQVPTLALDGGRVLTENVAVLQYLSDSGPGARTGAPDGYELLRWLSFVSTEVHKKVLAPIYAPSSPDAVREHARASAARALDVFAPRLEAKNALVGEGFTVADACLFWALTLLPHAGVSLDGYPSLLAYRKELRGRPSVSAALSFEKEAWE